VTSIGRRAVVVGEALVDLVVAVDGSVTAHLGGGPFNAARSAGRLGAAVSFLARVSDDRFGAMIRESLAADGVDLSAIVTTSDPTTLAVAELDERGAATYRFHLDGTSAPGLTVDDALAHVPDDVSVLCLGTLGLLLSPMAEASLALAESVRGRATVVVDPNIRTALLGDDDRAYRRRLDAVMALADVVKVSDDDLAWITPTLSADDGARALVERGARTVVVTRGSAGATAFGRDGLRVDVAGQPVTVVDTIGAGDSFVGALVARLVAEGDAWLDDAAALTDAVSFANRVAGITVSRAGASPPTLVELAGS
jgi:fructokinase